MDVRQQALIWGRIEGLHEISEELGAGRVATDRFRELIGLLHPVFIVSMCPSERALLEELVATLYEEK